MVQTKNIIDETYWQAVQITDDDIEFLYAHLLEIENPLSPEVLSKALIHERIRREKKAFDKALASKGDMYLPEKIYKTGDRIIFPEIDLASGVVKQVRPGENPDLGDFSVIETEMEDGSIRLFASGLKEHDLNTPQSVSDSPFMDAEFVLQQYGKRIQKKLENELSQHADLVKIGGNWFPKALLIDFNVGHLNLIEAVLDMNGGGPLPVPELLNQIDFQTTDNANLVEFSLNYALQEDTRFDEVGPKGTVLWFLNRLEPEFVREKPDCLKWQAVDYDRGILSDQMLALENEIDDELSPLLGEEDDSDDSVESISVCLLYPHLSVGSIPLTHRTRQFFPTALETPRVKFTLIDGENQKSISAWVVRPFNYVYGLAEWFEEKELMPGSMIRLEKTKIPGEVMITPEKRKANKEWVKTMLIGTDNGIVFAMLKKNITALFNDQMAIAIPDFATVEQLRNNRKERQLSAELVRIARELSKLNPQGHVHTLELYAAINIIRRCPPGMVYYLLSTLPEFSHVGDLYFHLKENLKED